MSLTPGPGHRDIPCWKGECILRAYPGYTVSGRGTIVVWCEGEDGGPRAMIELRPGQSRHLRNVLAEFEADILATEAVVNHTEG